MFSKDAFRLIVFSLQCLSTSSRNSSRSGAKTSKVENTREMEFHQSLNGGLSDSAQPKAQKMKDISSRKSKGFGLSAWALIGLILSVILCGVFLYYATIFYPILCKKERKYDVMEVSATP